MGRGAPVSSAHAQGNEDDHVHEHVLDVIVLVAVLVSVRVREEAPEGRDGMVAVSRRRRAVSTLTIPRRVGLHGRGVSRVTPCEKKTAAIRGPASKRMGSPGSGPGDRVSVLRG